MLDPAADHCITILVRRPRPELPFGHIMAFAGPIAGPWTEARLIGDGLLGAPSVERLLELVRDIAEIGACDVVPGANPGIGPRAVS